MFCLICTQFLNFTVAFWFRNKNENLVILEAMGITNSIKVCFQKFVQKYRSQSSASYFEFPQRQDVGGCS